MKTNRELEYKTLITKEQYDAIKATFFANQTPLEQTNDYYDTPDFSLLKNRCMCRIRKTKMFEEFTLKVPHETEGLTEYSFKEKVIHIDDDRIVELLASFKITQPLHFIASSHTCRFEHHDGIGIITLDQSTFNDQQDYELEYEITDLEADHQQAFLALCHRFNLTYTPAKPKVARTFQAYHLSLD